MAAPKTANISVVVGNTDYTISHTNFSSLTVDRTAKDVCDKFVLRLLDNDANEIEAALLSGLNNIQITYIDDTLKEYKKLSGFAISMSSAFVDNRCMLTIEGYVSTSIHDKYDKFSFSWNVVPKFDFNKVLGDAALTVKDENYTDDGFFDKLKQFFDFEIKNFQISFKNPTKMTVSIANWQNLIDTIFKNNQISMDDNGNYYIKRFYGTGKDANMDNYDVMNTDLTPEEESKYIVKNSGVYIIPIQPHKILKLICCGGEFSDLLEAEYSDYKGTSFYSQNLSEADWYFIKKWYKRMGSFQGLGYQTFKCNNETMVSEDEFVQTRQSFMEFMYNTVLSKCYYQDKDGNKYTNFYLTFQEGTEDNRGIVTLKRLDASDIPDNAPQYIYYGRFTDDGSDKGRMTSFSPKLNILTSMITGGDLYSQDADISNINLVGVATKNEGITVNAAGTTEGRYKVNWGLVKTVPTVTYDSNDQITETDIARVFNDAAKLPYRADATIDGFNKLNPQEYIEIIVIPRTKDGAPVHHHTSGIYFILSIKDTIENGKYTSELELIKNIQNLGNSSVSKMIADSMGEVSYKVTSSATNNSAPKNTLRPANNGGDGRKG